MSIPLRERMSDEEMKLLTNTLDEALHRPNELEAGEVSFANNLYVRLRHYGGRMILSARERSIVAHIERKLNVVSPRLPGT